MNNIMQDLHAAGFAVVETGGGCTAWRKSFGPEFGGYVLVTSALDPTSHEIENTVLDGMPRVMIGIYTESGDMIATAAEPLLSTC